MFARHVLATIEALRAGDHVCALLQSRAEELALIKTWVQRGVAQRERCLYLTRRLPDTELRKALTSAAEIVELEDKTHFDVDLALAWWAGQIEAAIGQGFAGLRVCSDISGYSPQVFNALADYHGKLNELLLGTPASAVCIYDSARCPSSALRDALDTHPYALIHDVICECPHYVHPEDYFAADRPLHETETFLERMYADTTSRAKRAYWARTVLAKMENERRAIARMLHDDLGQALTALALRDGDVVADTVGEALETLRAFSGDLRPSVLDDLGLAAGIRSLARRYSLGADIKIELDLALGDVVIEPEVATACYRIVEAELANVFEHAPTALVHVSLHAKHGALVLVVRDNWASFVPRQRAACFVDIALRCELVGGAIEIDPTLTGTTIRARVPL